MKHTLKLSASTFTHESQHDTMASVLDAFETFYNSDPSIERETWNYADCTLYNEETGTLEYVLYNGGLTTNLETAKAYVTTINPYQK